MKQPRTSKPPLLTRRRLLISAGILGSAALATGIYAWRIEPHWVHTAHLDMPIKNLPPGLVGKTLIQISDLHIGYLVDDDYMSDTLKSIATLNPDIIVITGDLMTCRSTERVTQAISVLKSLPPANLGTYAIMGNHDYGMGWSNPVVADTLQAQLATIGITVLRNKAQSVAGLQLVGLDDYWSPNFDPLPTLSQVDWSGPAITLSHNPDTVDLPGLHSIKGWVLSGHTHGGQCKPPFLPPPLLPVRNKRYTSGTFDIGHDRTLYINPGLGYLMHVRINVRPEVTVFTLRSA